MIFKPSDIKGYLIEFLEFDHGYQILWKGGGGGGGQESIANHKS